jgi:hypothetical protein
MPITNGATLSALDAILKTQYLGPVREQVPQKMVLHKRLKKNDDSVSGKNFTLPLHVGGNEGIGATGDGGTLPEAGNQQYKETIVPMKYNYGRIQITGPTIKAARNDAGAFIRAVESEMKGMVKDLKKDINRQWWGDGTGVLTLCSVTNASTTIVCSSTKYIRPGMKVDIIKKADGTTGTGAAGRKVISVTDATHFVIDGAAVTTDANYAVYRAGSRNFEMMGLGGIFSDSLKIQNVDPADFAWWKAQILKNGGVDRAISETLLQLGIDRIDENSEGTCTAMYSNYGVRRAYFNLLRADRQFINTKTFEGGFSYIDFDDKPWFVDKDCPAKSLFYTDEEELEIYRMSDFDWMDEDGKILHRVKDADAYEATIFYYAELGCSMRNAMVLIGDITEVNE